MSVDRNSLHSDVPLKKLGLKTWQLVAVLLAVLLLGGATLSCSSVSYYSQAVSGHLDVMERRRPVEAVISDPQTDDALKRRLSLVSQMRDYASRDLGLPENGSYRSYADVERPYLVWNVFAAPELSLEPVEWCYLLVGCLSYRGYFDRQQANEQAATLVAEGYEVWMGGVAAYSTLGWFDDPLLNTFLSWSEGRLAELIFHELAHQKIFVSGDSTFNESFASAVGHLGAEAWLRDTASSEAQRIYRAQRDRRRAFKQLAQPFRTRLETLYAGPAGEPEKREFKKATLAAFSAEYAVWKMGWEGYTGYDGVVATGPSNAWFAALSTYTEYLPAFVALYHLEGEDFERFYAAVEALAQRSEDERSAELERQLRRADRR